MQRVLPLAFRAVMAAAPSDDHTLDGSLAHQTRFTFSTINPMLQLKKSFFTISIYVIGDGGTAKLDGLGQNLTYREVQTPKIFLPQRRCTPTGPDLRAK